MERKEQIALALKPLLSKQLEIDSQGLVKFVEQKLDFIIKELYDVILDVLEQAVVQQQENLKGSITYISFSLLLSNILMEQHGFQVAAYDDRFFVDTKEAIADWRPDYIFIEMHQSFDLAACKIKQQIPRLLPCELIEPMHAFCLNYYAIATQILIHLLPYVFEKLSIPALKTADKVLVVTGLYMEKQDCIYMWG